MNVFPHSKVQSFLEDFSCNPEYTLQMASNDFLFQSGTKKNLSTDFNATCGIGFDFDFYHFQISKPLPEFVGQIT